MRARRIARGEAHVARGGIGIVALRITDTRRARAEIRITVQPQSSVSDAHTNVPLSRSDGHAEVTTSGTCLQIERARRFSAGGTQIERAELIAGICVLSKPDRTRVHLGPAHDAKGDR